MTLCLCQLLAGGTQGPAFALALSQVIDARADLGETLTDLLAAGLPALWLVVHSSSMTQPRTGRHSARLPSESTRVVLLIRSLVPGVQ